MKHTPGPWKTELNHSRSYSSEDDGVWEVNAPDPDGPFGEQNVAILDVKGDVETEANARLIAAAPNLLEVVKYLHWWIEEGGASKPISLSGLMDDNGERTIADAVRAAIAKAEGK